MMKLKFANDFNEYAEGQLHFKNDGSPIEVDNVLGRQLLFAKGWLGGEMVPVFAEVGADIETEPEGGHTVESLMALPKRELAKVARAAGLDGNEFSDKEEIAKAIIEATAAKGE